MMLAVCFWITEVMDDTRKRKMQMSGRIKISKGYGLLTPEDIRGNYKYLPGRYRKKVPHPSWDVGRQACTESKLCA